MLSNILKKNIEKGLNKIQINKIIVTYPDKTTSVFGKSGSTIDFSINSWKMLWLAITPVSYTHLTLPTNRCV